MAGFDQFPIVPQQPAQDPWAAFPRAADPLPGPAPVQAPPVDPRKVDSAADVGGYLAQSLTDGIANILGFPVDMINALPMIANLLPGEQGFGPISDYPIGGSQSIQDAFDIPRDVAMELIFGQEGGDLTTDNPALRVAGRAMEEVGAAVPLIGGPMATGLRVGAEGARKMQQSATPVTRMLGNSAERYAVKPVETTTKELGMATAAGTGGGLGQTFFDDGNADVTTTGEALADLFGSLLGGASFATATQMAKGIDNTIRAAAGNERYADRAAQDAATAEIARAAGLTPNAAGAVDTAPLVAQLRGRNPTADVVPGFQDSVADRTGNPGLAALEYSRQSGPNSGFYVQRRADNANAAADAMSDLAPTENPATFRTALDRGAEAQIDQATIARDAAQANFEQAISGLTAASTSEARGQTIRAALDDALAAARDVEREAWSGIAGEVDPAPLAARFDEITSGLTQSQQRVVQNARGAIDTPDSLTVTQSTDPIVSAVLGPDGRPFMRDPIPVSEMQDLAEITTLRSEFTSAMRAAEAAGDPNQARILGRYVDAIDGYLAEIPEVSEALDNARRVSVDLNDRFTRRGTAIGDSLATTRSGGVAVPDSNVAPRFVQPDTKQAGNIDRVLAETNNAAEVREALQDQILAGAEPLLDKPDRLEQFLGQYSRVFEKFPELRAQLGTAAGLRRTLDDVSGEADRVTKSLSPGGNSPTGRYRRFGAEDPVRSMRTVLGSDRPGEAARELLRVAGDTPQAREGLKSALWASLEDKARPTTLSNRVAGVDGRINDPWNFTAVVRQLDDPQFDAVARELYADNPEHLDNLRQLAETVRGADLREAARARNSSGTAQAINQQGLLPSTETLGAYSFAYQRGQIGLPFIALRVGATVARNAMRKGRASQFEAILDRALLDPEVAAVMLEEFNPATAEILARSAQGWAGDQAADIVDLIMSSGGDEEDDRALVDQVMESP